MIKYFFKIFIQIFIPFIFVFSLYTAVSYERSVYNAEVSYKEILKTYWLLVSEYNMENKEKVLSFLNHIDNKSDIRITLIDKKGNVVLDSSVEEKKLDTLENHLSRIEVEKAFSGQEYYDIRKSTTTGRYSIYYAALYNDKYVLRVVSDGIIFHNIYSQVKSDIILFFIVYTVLSVLISMYLAFRLTIPALELSKVAKAISENQSDFIMPQISDKIMNDAATLIYNINKLLIQEKYALNMERSLLAYIINYIDEAVILFDKENNILKANAQAYKFYNTIKEGVNPLVDNTDYESVVFFTNVLSEKKQTVKYIYKEQVYEVYIKEVDDYKLAVFRDITSIVDYDDFKAELTANIAHEMKTPVAIIMAASETLLQDKHIERDFAEKFLNKINTGSKRLNNIINQTLELYKMENTGLVIEENANIDNILLNILVKDNGKNIIYNNTTQKEYHIDALHVEMILTNLINNANKYSHGKNIYVKIYDNNALIIEVSDEGPMISEKEHKRIFERFYTVSKSRNNSGFGLGLSIVKHIALLYGGKATVFPNQYHGNTFQIILYEKL